MSENIVLIGFMACGKTTVGRELADRVGFRIVDLDEEIVARQGLSIPEIFALEGEEGFRRHESRLLAELADRSGLVLSTGGGIVTVAANWDVLRRLGPVVYLRARWETLAGRLVRESGRPLAGPGCLMEEVKQRFESRLPLYARADLTVDVDDRTPQEIAEAILAMISERDHACPNA